MANNYSPIYFGTCTIINRAKSIISYQVTLRFQRASFDALKFYLLTTDYSTQDMLSVCEMQDKGKGPYTENSRLLSKYLVIQVQESIKSYEFCCMP